MSGVVLRCPNCGTAQPGSGECEACREAEVRYFCTNHVPGIWLDSASCPRCGSSFGDPVPAREASRPPERPEPRPAPTVEPGPRLDSGFDDPGPWGGGGPSGRPGRGDPRSPSPDLGALVAAMLGAAARSRRGRAERPAFEEMAPRRRRGGGCLGRLLMLVLLLFALFLLAPFFLGALLNFG